MISMESVERPMVSGAPQLQDAHCLYEGGWGEFDILVNLCFLDCGIFNKGVFAVVLHEEELRKLGFEVHAAFSSQ